jgi:hypothetical protein
VLYRSLGALLLGPTISSALLTRKPADFLAGSLCVIVLLLWIADRNAFVFRSFRVLIGISTRYKATSDGATVYRFGWNRFCHLLVSPEMWASPPTGKWSMSSLRLRSSTPWPRGAIPSLVRDRNLPRLLSLTLGVPQNYSEGSSFPNCQSQVPQKATVDAVAFAFSVVLLSLA